MHIIANVVMNIGEIVGGDIKMKKIVFVLFILFVFAIPSVSFAERFCEFRDKLDRIIFDLDKVVAVSESNHHNGIAVFLGASSLRGGIRITNISYDCFVKLLKNKELNCEEFICKEHCCCQKEN